MKNIERKIIKKKMKTNFNIYKKTYPYLMSCLSTEEAFKTCSKLVIY